MPSVVAQFNINYEQILNENSVLQKNLPLFANDSAVLIHLYSMMRLTRHFDEKAIALQRIGKMGTYAPIHGQEAIGTAIGYMLKPEDVLIPYYRDYAALAQRGVPWEYFLSYWGGDERGSDFPKPSQDLPFCVPIASQCLHAAGIAMAFKYRSEKRVALVCIGDGGTSEGDFYEAINVAGALSLPVVFVINNNQWAISVPLHAQTAAQTLAQKGIAAGIDGVQVDGNDVLALCQVIEAALSKARRGDGPTLIEALSYRLSDHTTADDATRYQPTLEVSDAEKREPLARFKRFLQNQIQWNEEQETALQKSCEQTINTAIETYLQQKPQPISSMFDYHYHSLPDVLIEQRATAIEEAENA